LLALRAPFQFLGRGRHTIYRNPANGRCTAVPRHRESKDTTARAICDQLEVPRP
jgi:predicted RNA binding protein YcfA (HicA-like mRNA interferase family)